MKMTESDWKKFKKVRAVALDWFCRGVLDECQAICSNESLTAHDRYGQLYGLLQERDDEMARAFDDFRRSTAVWQLRIMVAYDLVTAEELTQFSAEVQRVLSIE